MAWAYYSTLSVIIITEQNTVTAVFNNNNNCYQTIFGGKDENQSYNHRVRYTHRYIPITHKIYPHRDREMYFFISMYTHDKIIYVYDKIDLEYWKYSEYLKLKYLYENTFLKVFYS